MHRAETVTVLILAVTMSGSCARPQPIRRDLQVGVHRVRVLPPPGWEILEHGRQHLFRNGEMQISLIDLAPAVDDSSFQAPRAIQTAYVLASFRQSERHEIAHRERRPVEGRTWNEVQTWSRVSHLDPGRVAYLENRGHFLVLAIDHGPIEATAPVFDSLLTTIQVMADSAGAK